MRAPVQANVPSRPAPAIDAGVAGVRPTRMSSARWIGLALFLTFPLLIIWIEMCTDIDLRLADAAFDPQRRIFPWREAWIADTFSHVVLKRMLVALAIAFVLAALGDLVAPRRWSWLRRYQIRVVALSAVLVPLSIALLKQSSDSHCPWDLARYGGSEPYVRLMQVLPVGSEPGHCLPAGHASSALWLISLAVFFLPARPRAAMGVFVSMMGFGFSLGWLQQLRGAHFLTHTLWSVWIAVFLVAAIAIMLDRRRLPI
jgi:membrane-associated PAP2 superfamily phosphatase